jgi:hypothetical protein
MLFILRSCCLMLLLLLCGACGGRQAAAPVTPKVHTRPAPAYQLTHERIAAMQAELAALECPAGCSATDFSVLRTSMQQVLADLAAGKGASKLPDESKSAVDDADLHQRRTAHG